MTKQRTKRTREHCRQVIEQLKVNSFLAGREPSEEDYRCVIEYYGLELCPTGGMQGVPELELDSFMLTWIYDHYPEIRKVLERREAALNCPYLQVIK